MQRKETEKQQDKSSLLRATTPKYACNGHNHISLASNLKISEMLKSERNKETSTKYRAWSAFVTSDLTQITHVTSGLLSSPLHNDS